MAPWATRAGGKAATRTSLIFLPQWSARTLIKALVPDSSNFKHQEVAKLLKEW
jgi:hypothetical protein